MIERVRTNSKVTRVGTLAGLAVLLALPLLGAGPAAPAPPPGPATAPLPAIAGGPAPDLDLVFTAQVTGWIEPCG